MTLFGIWSGQVRMEVAVMMLMMMTMMMILAHHDGWYLAKLRTFRTKQTKKVPSLDHWPHKKRHWPHQKRHGTANLSCLRCCRAKASYLSAQFHLRSVDPSIVSRRTRSAWVKVWPCFRTRKGSQSSWAFLKTLRWWKQIRKKMVWSRQSARGLVEQQQPPQTADKLGWKS